MIITNQMSSALNDNRLAEELDEIECSAILERHSTGRLAILEDGELDIFPVEYALDGKWIIFRVPSRLNLDRVNLNQLALEVDEIAEDGECSVVARGSAFEITRGLDGASIRERRLAVALTNENSRLVRIVPQVLKGRHVQRHQNLN